MEDAARRWLARSLGGSDLARGRLGAAGWSLPELRDFRALRVGEGNLILIRGRADAVAVELEQGSVENLIICEGLQGGTAKIAINGSANVVLLRQTRKFNGRITVGGNEHLFYWGRGATCNEGNFVLGIGGDGTSMLFGEDCMLSQRVSVRATDSHGMIDVAARVQVNRPGSIVIGPHVWLGNGAGVLKDVEIGGGAIVGAGALVTASLPPMTASAGIPARILRNGTTWTRQGRPTPAEIDAVLRFLDACGVSAG